MSTQQYSKNRNRSLDDLNILGRSILTVKEVFGKFENATKEVGLKMNEDRTKFLLQTRKQKIRLGQNVTFDRYNFEVVKFMYSEVNTNNGESRGHKKIICGESHLLPHTTNYEIEECPRRN